MTAKQFFSHPATITVIVIIVVVAIVYAVREYNSNSKRGGGSTYCACTKNSNCGRDQYCDGCYCQSLDINRIVPINTIVVKPAPTPVPNPPPRPVGPRT